MDYFVELFAVLRCIHGPGRAGRLRQCSDRMSWSGLGLAPFAAKRSIPMEFQIHHSTAPPQEKGCQEFQRLMPKLTSWRRERTNDSIANANSRPTNNQRRPIDCQLPDWTKAGWVGFEIGLGRRGPGRGFVSRCNQPASSSWCSAVWRRRGRLRGVSM